MLWLRMLWVQDFYISSVDEDERCGYRASAGTNGATSDYQRVGNKLASQPLSTLAEYC